jgi:hypothetical protein
MPDIAEYCRELETYLCRKNGGHLIRIVGPAFERVKGWAEQGVPLSLALRGVDRCCERVRAQGRGPRRRPVRIEFCEADILELFDDWRRAIGAVGGAERAQAARQSTLASHIERVIQRLLAVPAQGGPSSAVALLLERAVPELDVLLERSRRARGGERTEIVDRLAALDRALIAAAADTLDPTDRDRLRRDAEAEVAPFVARMTAQARAAALDAAVERLVRETLKLPAIAYQ